MTSRNEGSNSILMTRHYPDLGSASYWFNQISHAARPISCSPQIWVVTRYQYGISALVSQTSFRGKTSGSVAKCRLVSQATFLTDSWQSLLFHSDKKLNARRGSTCNKDRGGEWLERGKSPFPWYVLFFQIYAKSDCDVSGKSQLFIKHY